MDIAAIDEVKINFTPESLTALNFILGGIMFGIALELTPQDFKRILLSPKAVLIGLSSQLLLLPLLTFVLVIGLHQTGWIVPSLGLGMILVAACPGGNTSNFISMLAKGNVALSVSLTAVVTLLAVLVTPLNFTFWANQYPVTAQLLESIQIDFVEMFKTVMFLLGLPLIAGMLFNYYFPKITAKIIRPIKVLSLVIFMGFVFVALYVNRDVFLGYIHILAPIVLIHNAVGLIGGYVYARLLGLSRPDRRSVSIETGMQNTGLALVLAFAFFQDSPALGGMAAISAWYGIWHLVSGLFLAQIWSKR